MTFMYLASNMVTHHVELFEIELFDNLKHKQYVYKQMTDV